MNKRLWVITFKQGKHLEGSTSLLKIVKCTLGGHWSSFQLSDFLNAISLNFTVNRLLTYIDEVKF